MTCQVALGVEEFTAYIAHVIVLAAFSVVHSDMFLKGCRVPTDFIALAAGFLVFLPLVDVLIVIV